MSDQKSYFLGCPVWSCPAWRGTIYPNRVHQREWLKHYSRRFNSVEGNSTFYAIPSPEVAHRWASLADEGFRFALKFPRVISHEHQLEGADTELHHFLNVLEILEKAGRLGPTFLQLSPWFGPQKFPVLEKFLRSLPQQYPYAVEVRQLDFFEPTAEQKLDDLLKELQVDRVIFDSRALYSAPPTDDFEAKSQTRKPKSPVRKQVTGTRPLLRLIGRNQVELAQPWIDEWTDQVATWIAEGLEPYVFTHTPDDRFAPEMAARFHESLSRKVPHLNPMPDWVPPAPKQLDLF